jgi:hypothetical protein
MSRPVRARRFAKLKKMYLGPLQLAFDYIHVREIARTVNTS